MQDKDSFRKIVKARRGNGLTANEDRKNAEIIVDRYLDSEYFKKADIIFAYSSMKDEIPTERIIQTALERGKRVALPKVISTVSEGARMEYYDRYLAQFDRKRFHITALAYEYQIFEAVPTKEYDSKVDLVITENRWID